MFSAFIKTTNSVEFMHELNVAQKQCLAVIVSPENRGKNLEMKVDYKPIVTGKTITYTAVVYC